MEVIETLLPIMIIVFTGYMVAKKEYLTEAECTAVSRFVLTYLIPALLFYGASRAQVPDNLNWSFLYAFYGGVIAVYLIAVCLGKQFFGYNHAQQSSFAMGAAYSNATIVGIPICVIALGEEALLPCFILISVHNVILFTLGIFMAERGKFAGNFIQNLQDIFRQLTTSPVTASLLAGGMVNYFDIVLYPPVEEAIGMVGKSTIPIALFSLGATLNRFEIKGNIAPALTISGLKILLLPFFVWMLAFHVFTIDPLWASVAVLSAAMPVGFSAFIFSHRYQACEAAVAAALVKSTLGSILTLTLVLWYIHKVVGL